MKINKSDESLLKNNNENNLDNINNDNNNERNVK